MQSNRGGRTKISWFEMNVSASIKLETTYNGKTVSEPVRHLYLMFSTTTTSDDRVHLSSKVVLHNSNK
jgi:hypothetical protein